MANFKVGMKAVEVVSEIVRLEPLIDGVWIITYNPIPNLVASPKTPFKQLVRQGVDLQRKKFLQAEVNPKSLTEWSLLKQAVLGVESLTFKGGAAVVVHIPMMDFCCPKTEESLERIKEAMTGFLPGSDRVLLDSGQSYHFYGAGVLCPEEWQVFLGKCLLLTGLTDPRYIGHSLVAGYCTLRLTASSLRPKIPEVIAVF